MAVLFLFTSMAFSGCASKLEIKGSKTGPDGTKTEIGVKIEFPPAPSDGGGSKTNKENKEENGNKGASFMYIHTGGSNVDLVNEEPPHLILTLTQDNVPKYSKVFPAVINNDVVFFKNPDEVDLWAEPYLELTNGINLETNLIMERIPGLNTVVVKAYYDTTLVNATATSEWVTDLDPDSTSYTGSN